MLGGSETAFYLAGLAVLVGHWFPIWLHGRGGIGQAAATGFLGAMWPEAMLAGLAAFALGRLALHSFDAAYGLGAAVYLAGTFWLGNSWSGGYSSCCCWSARPSNTPSTTRGSARFCSTWPKAARQCVDPRPQIATARDLCGGTAAVQITGRSFPPQAKEARLRGHPAENPAGAPCRTSTSSAANRRGSRTPARGALRAAPYSSMWMISTGQSSAASCTPSSISSGATPFERSSPTR